MGGFGSFTRSISVRFHQKQSTDGATVPSFYRFHLVSLQAHSDVNKQLGFAKRVHIKFAMQLIEPLTWTIGPLNTYFVYYIVSCGLAAW
jgi:hypothetical protein